MLKAVSPIDGRYAKVTAPLVEYFSEYALIRNRVLIEVKYFEALCRLQLPQLSGAENHLDILRNVIENFSEDDARAIKDIEKITNHDVKAVEYFIKKKLDDSPLEPFKEFIHFGLTSQDINNTAQPLALLQANYLVLFPLIEKLIQTLEQKSKGWMNVSLLAFTHGQPASPTTLGKELYVFVARLQSQFEILKQIPITGKFGGATGNFNAHHVAYPDLDWHSFANEFVQSLGIVRIPWTTQIEPYDYLAAYCHGLMRINTICMDLCKDIWMYISMQTLKQKAIANEIGSSAMPHKVNPIDFENAEGNLGLGNALLDHFANKLPVSRLQRDLTDSTVLRNLGVPLGHSMIAYHSILKGLGKIDINQKAIDESLEANWVVVAEAIQTILRREGVPDAYELLKELTRGKSEVSKNDILEFIENLPVSHEIRLELRNITPQNYIGIFPK